jgi:hypothetical protein
LAPWARALGIFVALLAITYFLRVLLLHSLKQIDQLVIRLAPWLAVIALFISVLIYLAIKPPKEAFQISFDSRTSALFNSWDHGQTPKYFEAYGDADNVMLWTITDRRTAYFNFRSFSPLPQSDDSASSGGYITFYDKPCDRLIYGELSFKCRITDTTDPQPDLGIRLAVDDPHEEPTKRERVMYELASVNKYLNGKQRIDDTWQTFTIDIRNFQQKRYMPPFPSQISATTINKIVFFINVAIIHNCKHGRIWISDILFR